MCSQHLKNHKIKSCGCLERKSYHRYKPYPKKHNEYIFKQNYIVGLTNNTNSEFFIDFADYDKIKDFLWHETEHGYRSTTNKDGKKIYLHKMLTNYKITDHKNRNKKDNRQENLREANPSQNSANTSIPINNNSGIIGVSQTKNKTWNSQIQHNYKTIHLGIYKNKTEAIIARLKAEKELFGEFAPQNHLFDKYNI